MNMTDMSKELGVSNAVLKTVVDKHHMSKLTGEEIDLLKETFGKSEDILEEEVEDTRTPLQRMMFG